MKTAIPIPISDKTFKATGNLSKQLNILYIEAQKI